VPRPARALTRLAMIGALVAALGLAGCGRKGPLEPPPAASISAPAGQVANGQATDKGFDHEGKPVAPKGKERHIFLDWLLN